MHRERIADDVYVFISDLYAQVTATVVATKQGAVVFDTLLFPEETVQIERFIEQRLKLPVAYVINSHYHTDHTAGSSRFKTATVVGHRRCLELLQTRGREGIDRAKQDFADLRALELRTPDCIFELEHELCVGDKTFYLWSTPGHSPDSIVCLLKEERILLAGDTVMPIPVFSDGNYDDLVQSLRMLQDGNYEMIVQGHGEIILRGEIETKLRDDLEYLSKLYSEISSIINLETGELPRIIDIESCGASRALLGGEAVMLHKRNAHALARMLRHKNTVEIGSQHLTNQ